MSRDFLFDIEFPNEHRKVSYASMIQILVHWGMQRAITPRDDEFTETGFHQLRLQLTGTPRTIGTLRTPHFQLAVPLAFSNSAHILRRNGDKIQETRSKRKLT